MAISDDKVKAMKNLVFHANSDVLSNCLFCEKPVLLTKDHIEKEIVDFAMLVQRAYFHMDGKHIQKDLQGFVVCKECSGSAYKIKIAKQLAEVHFNLNEINETFAKALVKQAATQKAQEELQKQLESLEKQNGESEEK